MGETDPGLLAHHYTAAGLHEQAVIYWQRAGQHARERSAYVEAIGHFNKGLEVIPALPDTPARMEHEITLQIGLGQLLRVTMAHAARTTIVTVEETFDGDLLADERMAAGTLPALYVTAVAQAPRGAWPLAFHDEYAADASHLAEYARLARNTDGFARYVERHVLSRAAA